MIWKTYQQGTNSKYWEEATIPSGSLTVCTSCTHKHRWSFHTHSFAHSKNSSQAVVERTFNFSTWEGEAGWSLWAWDQRGLQSKFQVSQSCYTDSPCLRTNKQKSKTETIGYLQGTELIFISSVTKTKWCPRTRINVDNFAVLPLFNI